MRPRIPDLRDARKRHARARAHQLWLRAARRRLALTPGGLDPVTGGAIEVGVASAWRSNQAGRLAQQHEHEQDERRVAQAPYEAVEGPQQRTADQAAKHASRLPSCRISGRSAEHRRARRDRSAQRRDVVCGWCRRSRVPPPHSTATLAGPLNPALAVLRTSRPATDEVPSSSGPRHAGWCVHCCALGSGARRRFCGPPIPATIRSPSVLAIVKVRLAKPSHSRNIGNCPEGDRGSSRMKSR